jgi:hypothetical protein
MNLVLKNKLLFKKIKNALSLFERLIWYISFMINFKSYVMIN